MGFEFNVQCWQVTCGTVLHTCWPLVLEPAFSANCVHQGVFFMLC
jgi:hypothetical protein